MKFGSRLSGILEMLEESKGESHIDLIEQNVTKKTKTGKKLFFVLYSQVSLNHTRYINDHFISQNQLLEPGGDLVCWFQTNSDRKSDIYKQYPVIVREIAYTFDSIWHRVCPKLPGLRQLYFAVNQGRYQAISRPEILGRLYYCGFKVVNEFRMGHKCYVVAKKIRKLMDASQPAYWPIIQLKRIGKDGKLINVYKFRTMYAYSEYLQAHIYAHNNLAEGGKFANDYRIPRWGKFLRKFWLDEIPMIINLIKGDIKLVGVRPLSSQYYNLYSQDLQDLRIQTKPGLLPPYYADLPKTLEEIQSSEIAYLKQYFQNPRLTDWEYFWRILYNILVKKKRSA